VYPLEGGNGLRLTTALYYTPGGRSIQEVGIGPDIVVAAALPSDSGEEANRRRRMREADLDRHFTHEDAEPGAGRGDSDDEDAVDDDLAIDAAEGEDIQLARALEVLKSWTYFERLRQEDDAATVHALSAEDEPTAATQ
jgi:carboxyl-terminal processing protease